MVNGRNIAQYIFDLAYGASKYPCGWIKPSVAKGYFNDDEIGHSQKLFFDELLQRGWRRTFWQLVFPNQTAGLIKRIRPLEDGVDEYHVRFYSDGVIDCELEVNRFNKWHWAGNRKHGTYLLEEVLENMNYLSSKEKLAIKSQFGIKYYTGGCIRR